MGESPYQGDNSVRATARPSAVFARVLAAGEVCLEWAQRCGSAQRCKSCYDPLCYAPRVPEAPVHPRPITASQRYDLVACRHRVALDFARSRSERKPLDETARALAERGA